VCVFELVRISSNTARGIDEGILLSVREVRKVSTIEEANRIANLQAIEDRKVAEAEHLVVMNRERLTAESYNDPRLQAFKARRREQAMQLRWWKTSVTLVLPKKRF
jgi:hypothetical protein